MANSANWFRRRTAPLDTPLVGVVGGLVFEI